MAIDLDELPLSRKDHLIGQDLAALSIEELKSRIEALKAEISRLEHEIEKKSAHRDAASSVFRL
jgi:uncharacterized small protein (DUF1192 family)